jgi:hypothetical protein
MKTLLRLGTIMVLLQAYPSAALAADKCLKDAFGNLLVFKRVKILRPGGAVALTGMFISGAVSSPLTGAAVMRADGTVRVGVFLHTLHPTLGTVNATYEWTADADFAGAGVFDTDGDYLSNGAISFLTYDCKAFPIP